MFVLKYRHNKVIFSKLYKVWGSMIARCGKRRGYIKIRVCDEWRNNFSLFETWANENGYRHGLQIDRINNLGNYDPSNCRWVTPKVNCSNRRNTVKIHWNGTDLTTSQVASMIGVTDKAILYRLRLGLPVQTIVTTPKIGGNRKQAGKWKEL